MTRALLRAWPLPQPDDAGDKESRGRVLVVGGAPEMPGAVILAGIAALRAGAGKLRIATCRSIAPYVAAAVPEARVIALAETKRGAIAPRAAAEVVARARRVRAVLVGPGCVGEDDVRRLLERLLPALQSHSVILDAAAIAGLNGQEGLLESLSPPAIVTPHGGEMAALSGVDRQAVLADPLSAARAAAVRLGAVVTLKGPNTLVVGPDGEAFVNTTGNVGLATSGSGDTLAGIIAGLAARGADPLQAAAWGVYLHGRAGDELAARIGQLGFLAREIPDEVPRLMAEFDGPARRRRSR